MRKTYGGKRNSVTALDGVTVGFARAGFTAVMAPSGSGKSTFLHCAAGLDRPTGGSVLLADQDLSDLSEVGLTKLRREQIGFVFQAFNLLPALTVQDNVTLPLRLSGRRASQAKEGAPRIPLAAPLPPVRSAVAGGRSRRPPGCGVPCRAWPAPRSRSSSLSSRRGTAARRSAGW